MPELCRPFAAVATGGRTGICERLSTFDGTRESNLNGRFLGLTLGVVIGFVAAVLMDHFKDFTKRFIRLW